MIFYFIAAPFQQARKVIIEFHDMPEEMRAAICFDSQRVFITRLPYDFTMALRLREVRMLPRQIDDAEKIFAGAR